MSRSLRLLLLLLFVASVTGCQTLSDLAGNLGLSSRKSAPTPFSESIDAWDGTWAEQKDQ